MTDEKLMEAIAETGLMLLSAHNNWLNNWVHREKRAELEMQRNITHRVLTRLLDDYRERKRGRR